RAALEAARAASRSSAERRGALREGLRLLQGGARVERRRAAQAEADAARAGADAMRASAGDLVMLAPMDGVVTSRHAEPGEVLGPGQSALTIGAPSRPWARVYVSQFVLQALSVGDTLVARLDGDTTTYRGRVVAIATKAEFTPRVALTDDERADLLFGVKLEFDDPDGRLKAGLPITVVLPPSAATGRR
ncbi:MAG: HlyD family efflux transporter periplasmic adaptor subunit, partial [Gemmatimonadota bacterium]